MAPNPTPTDGFPTPTSRSQAETEAVLLKHIPDTDAPAPSLQKNAHMQFLVRNLVQGFPTRYISQDASQPWLLFWTVQAFSVLQVGLDPGNKQRCIDKIMTWQHPEGGFGGGPGQAAHLLPTYASVCALAIVGRPGPNGGWDQVDRSLNYYLQRSNTTACSGIYCLLTVATLLDILTPELVQGTASFIASCQTYEGGFASASHPSTSLSGSLLPPPAPRPPLGEAHGGYTFCALASWVLLRPYLASASQKEDAPTPTIDVKNLLRWLVNMQGIEIELGGFKGRTNKLVDGCYSWWCGGAFALLEALGVGGIQNADSDEVPIDSGTGPAVWDDVDDGLYNRQALQENADAYHTLYCLSGLSSAQHHVFPSLVRRQQLVEAWDSADTPQEDLRKRLFTELLSWTEEEGQTNRLNATHPLTNLTITHTEAIAAHFYNQRVPPRPRLRSAPTA
ncbi:terpenoid cyclases/protein prenyltransferase alpha-alpha toroid [Flammula alnicola]|nr:terpenoid cyclases/protein prenyltransferase alpha-alpha toroid [Flammula alnicola]